ncbi:hypothetical protein THAR02_08203 [Trichoderma harzianum]|uniref:Fungal N-terminal domain-containing protein n=1 Tax=Trichoderma harzianum TaxID=5544 RepID=A0A0F9X3C2_TRIHA|nr:hypothetical protein THAR02_08203 [Trichoderma harzianum]
MNISDSLMDPIAILGAASSLVVSLARASKSLSDIQKGLKQADVIIASMIAECNTISAALTRLQRLALRNPIVLSPNSMPPEDVRESFDSALTGCMLVLSSLETQLKRITENGEPETMRFTQKLEMLWREEDMNRLLEHLRGQHSAINTLVSLLQTVSETWAVGQHVSLRTDSISNLNLQLQRSTAYQNAEAITVEELWQRNEQLKDENGELQDTVFNLEQETEKKGHTISTLLANVAALQEQSNELKQQLQAVIEKSEQYAAYDKILRQTGTKIVQQIQQDRLEIEHLEGRLSNLRNSHGSLMLAHLMDFHKSRKELNIPRSPSV